MIEIIAEPDLTYSQLSGTKVEIVRHALYIQLKEIFAVYLFILLYAYAVIGHLCLASLGYH